MRFGWLLLLAIAIVIPIPAFAQQTVFGYQLGLTQSAGTTIGDVQVVPAQADPPVEPGEPVEPPPPIDEDQAIVSQSQGLQLTTSLNANLTIDISTRSFSHALVFGAGVAQLVPTLLPKDENGQVQMGVVDDRTTTLQLNANYLSIYQRPKWAFSLGAGYGFALNGLLSAGADGRVQGGQVANAGNNIPGQQVGALSFNGQTHTVNGRLTLQLTPSLKWDATINGNYAYTRNGLFTLQAGALGAQNQAGTVGTNLGVFVPATIHTIQPSVLFRRRAGRNGQIDGSALVTYTLAEDVDDRFTITGTTTQVFRAIPPPAPTLLNQLSLRYAYNFNDARSVGVEAIGSLNYRVPTDQTGIVLANSRLTGDTLIYSLRAFYADILPWELRISAGAGVAQAWLFQPPLGALEDRDTFETVRSSVQPIFDLTLGRRFEPVDVTFFITRTIGTGALGISAITTEAASLVFGWVGDFGDFRPALAIGFNANRVRGIGRDQFELANPNDPAVLAFNNQSAGVNVALSLPLFESGGLSFDFAANYGFNYVDPDPGNDLGLNPLITHTVFGAVRALYGRGTAQTAAGAGGRTMEDELDAFTADPANGSPLLSNQLVQAGDPLQQGRRIGQAPEARRDSRQAYQQAIQQQAIEQRAREQSGVVQSVGTTEQEERRAVEAEKKREEEDQETPPIPSAWPEPAAEESPPPPPPPPPPR